MRTLAQVLGGNWSNSTTKEEVEAFTAGEHPGPGLNDFRLAFKCPTSDSWNLTAAQVFSTIWYQYLLGKHQFSNLSAHLIDKLTMMLNNAHYLQTIPLHTIQGEFMARYKEFKGNITWPTQTVTLEWQIGRQLKLSEGVAMGTSVPYAMFDHGLRPLTIVSTVV